MLCTVQSVHAGENHLSCSFAASTTDKAHESFCTNDAQTAADTSQNCTSM